MLSDAHRAATDLAAVNHCTNNMVPAGGECDSKRGPEFVAQRSGEPLPRFRAITNSARRSIPGTQYICDQAAVRHLTRLTLFGNLAPNISGPQSLKGNPHAGGEAISENAALSNLERIPHEMVLT